MNKTIVRSLVIGIVTSLVQSCNDSEPVVAKATMPLDIQFPKTDTRPGPASNLKMRLNYAISGLRIHEKDGQDALPNTPEEMVNRIGSENERALFKEAQSNPDKEISKLVAQLRKELTTYQLVTFPKIRRHYQEFLKQVYWEADIEVKLGGTRNTILTFIGGTFAANANKQKMMDAINNQVIALRFKKVNYKWIPDEDNYTYYKIESPNDNAIQ